jgi:GAF domain-containing protein
MTLAVARLQPSLELRDREAITEQAAGHGLGAILDRYLRTVEASVTSDLLTSVLLLDSQGTRLLHGAAPSLPKAYCDAIHGSEIGPSAGSCGTAAYWGNAVYVTDIATDPLWENYKHLALAHGLRACWSTPIESASGQVVGTFAIYHLTPRSPTPEELAAIRLITRYVSEAICGRVRPGLGDGARSRGEAARYLNGAADGVFRAAANGDLGRATPRTPVGARSRWKRMQQIERCRHQAEMAERAHASASAASRDETASIAKQWRSLANEYELLLQREIDDLTT